MRIGLFSDTFPPDINGVANSTSILCDALRSRGHEVFVVAPKEGSGPAEWDETHRILYLYGFKLEALYGYVVTSPLHIHAMNEIRKMKPDIIHVQTEFGVGIFARICAKQLDIPLVSTYHTTYEDYTHYVNPLHSSTVDTYAKRAVSYMSKLYGDSSAAVIAPSEKTKELLKSYNVRSDIFVVPTGLPLDRFAPEHEDPARSAEIRAQYGIGDSLFIIYVGRIAKEKSLDLVIDGFANLKKRGTDVQFLVVGGGPDLDGLKEKAVSLGLQDMVHFAGPVPSAQVPDYYRAADAFVSASLSETQGMTFIEAMASGLPLFARRDEVLDQLLVPEETGWFFKDAEDFPDLVAEFAAMDAESRAKMKQACLDKTVPYSSDTFAARAEEVYKHAIALCHDMASIEDIKVREDSVQLYLKRIDGEEDRVTVSLDDYYSKGLKRGTRISDTQIAELHKREESIKAYESCIRRIAVKDRTRREMHDWLQEHTELTEDSIEEIIGRLEIKGYIDDQRYAESAVGSMKAALFGEERIAADLRRKGLPEETINAAIAKYPHDEIRDAKEFAVRVQNSVRNESVRMKKKKLENKLIQKGYSADTARNAVASLDYAADELTETENLRNCANKAMKRYMHKHSGRDLRNAVYRYCMSQGYPSEEIYAVLDEMEWEND